MSEWKPISELPAERKMVVLVAIDVLIPINETRSTLYSTDPYCGWRNSDGSFARWPHPFPPTHFATLPEIAR